METNSFHKFIAEKLKEKKGLLNNVIQRKEVRQVLYISHVPLRIHNQFLKELIHLKIIRIKNKKKIEILGK